ncbi:hypothetical protein RFI_35061 [Reticulomyxa filosa]|uniref:Uncharacterized protein n=1 Tax=Reticulomyxa filosa TaxID=46433 RepID=X6LNV8_RETFI|nr:hypothetical protein RFI_35061 [Reticulomyxa filosa]|eukprot:ETO02375.1 hypothetical protein RFI_35061 [Reticulomyxa filosa]
MFKKCFSTTKAANTGEHIFNTKFKNKKSSIKILHCKIIVTDYCEAKIFYKICIYLSFQNVSYLYISSVFPFLNKSSTIFFILHHQKTYKNKLKKLKNEFKLINETLLHVIETVKRRRDPNNYSSLDLNIKH